METRCKATKLENWRVKLGFKGKLVVDSFGNSGGLCLFWSDEVNVDLLSFSQAHIDVRICHFQKPVWRFTGFYGHPRQDQRCHSWTMLRRLAGMSKLPWICMGDFNEILWDSEKLGGITKNWKQVSDFRETLEDCGLEDMGFMGPNFTWCNKRDGDAMILERLDRASETHPIDNRDQKSGGRFYFEECWASEQECADIVLSSWQVGASTNSVDSILRNIKACGQNLFWWNKRKRNELRQNIINRKVALREASINIRPGSWNVINGLGAQLDDALNLEERYWCQRARVEWLKSGERNTRFFHSKANARKARNKIIGLFDNNGRWWDTSNDITRIITEYLRELFRSSSPLTYELKSVLGDFQRRIPVTMSHFLDSAFTGEEDKIGQSVVNACLYVLNNGASMKGLNRTIIVLIPKVHNPSKMTEYRPISLCNVFYKAIAKTISNRFRSVLDGVISENQSAFIPGHRISDNTIIGFECLYREAQSRGTIPGFRCSRAGPAISHLIFADDSMIFTKANTSNCSEVRKLLDTYATFSGRKKRKLFTDIVDRVWNKIKGWGEKLLSVGGKEILIKAVIQSIPTYAMNLFRLPKTLIIEIHRLCNRFWWGSIDKDMKLNWCSWSRLCKHKMDGGLGFRDLEAFNRALLANQCWRILKSPNSLAAKVLKGCYFKHISFMEAKNRPASSFIWRSLCWGKEVLEKGLRWRVGDGTSIRVYTDKWIPRQSTFKIMSLPSLGVGIHTTVDHLFSPSGGWDNRLLEQSFSEDDVKAIQSIPVGSRRCGDSLIWHYTDTGAFPVKSGYWVARNMEEQPCSSNSGLNNSNSWWKRLWNLKIPLKIKLFIWKGCFDWIPYSGKGSGI
ncbi:hypothetical protein Dsin_017415 [Dipteronia sinensis]|uniref:Reverse transcriptase domain-containing protein n=1 Tax=Dipteronia sinensis TaxID=43782 RepID=A0AAE0AF04_9ROSI|nr:hypothetical protein Dsin_017415 [Dipteronia sinensis]